MLKAQILDWPLPTHVIKLCFLKIIFWFDSSQSVCDLIVCDSHDREGACIPFRYETVSIHMGLFNYSRPIVHPIRSRPY